MIGIGILGHGVVGSGVARMLMENSNKIRLHAGQPLELLRILDLRDFPGIAYEHMLTKDAQEVLNHPEISIVVECMGGLHPAYEYVKTAIENHKHVVTSNKELIAACGTELLALAKANQVHLMYEASVGGGIPVIRPLKTCLAANHLDAIVGILNGTTNYILSRMETAGVSFETALKEAQAAGYAERDPSADVDGWDARRKICILAHVAFGAELEDVKISTSGIRALSRKDMAYAKGQGMTIKLLGVAHYREGICTARVAPYLVGLKHPLAAVTDVYNAVMVHGDRVGNVMFYGQGAGSDATASAVIGDVMQAAIHGHSALEEPDLPIPEWQEDEEANAFFFRVRFEDRQEAIDAIAEGLPGAQLIWMEGDEFIQECGVRTQHIQEDLLEQALDVLKGSGLMPTNPIRIHFSAPV